MRASVHTFKYKYLRNKSVNCDQILSEAPLGCGKGVVNTPALSFLIRSSSFLQVTRTTIRLDEFEIQQDLTMD